MSERNTYTANPNANADHKVPLSISPGMLLILSKFLTPTVPSKDTTYFDNGREAMKAEMKSLIRNKLNIDLDRFDG
mgnify:CR=1 FL=1